MLGWLTIPPPVQTAGLPPADVPELTGLGDWLAANEAEVDAAYGLVPGTEKRIRWQVAGEKTEVALVYLHGFSASRQETAPLAAKLADGLGANLFETRLSGHGHERDSMAGVAAEDWVLDAAEAIAVGAQIGERVVVLAVSTGATAVLALHNHSALRAASDLVFISPNFRPADPASAWVTGPFGPQLTRLIAGSERSWDPGDDEDSRYWSSRYPIEAVIEVMRLVDAANDALPATLEQRLLVLLSLDDQVVSPQISLAALDRISAPDKQIVEVDYSEDGSQHVLAGDIIAPLATDRIAATILSFLERPAP